MVADSDYQPGTFRSLVESATQFARDYAPAGMEFFCCCLLSSELQILPPGRMSWVSTGTAVVQCVPGMIPCNQLFQFIELLLIVECGRVHSAAICMLNVSYHLGGILISVQQGCATFWLLEAVLSILNVIRAVREPNDTRPLAVFQPPDCHSRVEFSTYASNISSVKMLLRTCKCNFWIMVTDLDSQAETKHRSFAAEGYASLVYSLQQQRLIP
ncbi:hypothetical protein T02_280 [Trichinella nativa]|uniref:Uncharacterized protein n=1 Tax=Trichinella nativa TaxID=6335 RepID=A0A0V1KPT7_9BILA|nr:hypothetical protein T02_280 [Trichinella nativa]